MFGFWFFIFAKKNWFTFFSISLSRVIYVYRFWNLIYWAMITIFLHVLVPYWLLNRSFGHRLMNYYKLNWIFENLSPKYWLTNKKENSRNFQKAFFSFEMSKVSISECEPLRRNYKATEAPELTTFQRLMPQVIYLLSFPFAHFCVVIDLIISNRLCCRCALHCHFSTLAWFEATRLPPFRRFSKIIRKFFQRKILRLGQVSIPFNSPKT